MRKKSKRFTHWTCPMCNVLIPNYKNKWDSMEVKIKNHLLKFHSDKYSRQEVAAVLGTIWRDYQEVIDSY